MVLITALLLMRDYCTLGHIKEVFNPNGWEFHNDLLKNYGAAVKLDGILKVCPMTFETQINIIINDHFDKEKYVVCFRPTGSAPYIGKRPERLR